MRILKTKINESRSDKRTLRAFVKSVEKTVENMSYFPEPAFLFEIVKQILINEDLDDKFIAEPNIDPEGVNIIAITGRDQEIAATIFIITEKFSI